MESFQKDDFDERTDLFGKVFSSSFTEARTLEMNPYISQFIASAWTETADEYCGKMMFQSLRIPMMRRQFYRF